jgi:hypothetical protein
MPHARQGHLEGAVIAARWVEETAVGRENNELFHP